MKYEEFQRAISRMSLSTKLLNPLVGLQHSKRQPNQRSESKDTRMDRSEASLAIRVTIISMRRKLVDSHDNLRTGAKPLVDRIAETIGIDDGDPRITWEYHQLVSVAKEGTIVIIEKL